MSDANNNPPAENSVPPMSLPDQFDAIYARLVETDPTANRIRKAIDQYSEKMSELAHRRHLHVVMLSAHCRRLRTLAAEELKTIAGVKTLPGFRAQKETQAQFQARMNAARKAAEELLKAKSKGGG